MNQLKQEEDEMLEALFHLTLLCADLVYEQGIVSDTTISIMVEGTEKLTLGNQAKFYQEALKILETTHVEDEILAQTKVIMSALLKSQGDEQLK